KQRRRGGGAGDSDEQGGEKILEFQAQISRQLAEFGVEGVPLPMAQAVEAPAAELENCAHRLGIELGVIEALRRDGGKAAEQEAGQGWDVGELLDPLLDQRYHPLEVVAVEGPLCHPVGELIDVEVLANPAAVEPVELLPVEHRPPQVDIVEVELANH